MTAIPIDSMYRSPESSSGGIGLHGTEWYNRNANSPPPSLVRSIHCIHHTFRSATLWSTLAQWKQCSPSHASPVSGLRRNCTYTTDAWIRCISPISICGGCDYDKRSRIMVRTKKYEANNPSNNAPTSAKWTNTNMYLVDSPLPKIYFFESILNIGPAVARLSSGAASSRCGKRYETLRLIRVLAKLSIEISSASF